MSVYVVVISIKSSIRLYQLCSLFTRNYVLSDNVKLVKYYHVFVAIRWRYHHGQCIDEIRSVGDRREASKNLLKAFGRIRQLLLVAKGKRRSDACWMPMNRLYFLIVLSSWSVVFVNFLCCFVNFCSAMIPTLNHQQEVYVLPEYRQQPALNSRFRKSLGEIRCFVRMFGWLIVLKWTATSSVN